MQKIMAKTDPELSFHVLHIRWQNALVAALFIFSCGVFCGYAWSSHHQMQGVKYEITERCTA